MTIENFYINNFRSLVDFKTESFDTTTVFFGENNAGKSNILKALQIIFQRKPQDSEGSLTSPVNFYSGIIEDFSHDFFNNNTTLSIDFSVKLSVMLDELDIDSKVISLFKDFPEEVFFYINGKIVDSKLGDNFAEIKTSLIKVNDTIIYNTTADIFNYFETIETEVEQSELSEAFTKLVDPLNDCVYIIESGRNTKKTEFNNDLIQSFDPEDFKSSIYSLSLDEKMHGTFEEINAVFNSFPFSFGEISFARINSDLEIMIKNVGIRLPLKSLGSGVEQILFIIASLIFQKHKIVCIEELEQNLSPKLQNLALRKIQSMIGSHCEQLIISSHSSVFAKQKLSKAIYLIEKKDMKTIVSELHKTKPGEKIKKHFIDAALPYDTYTEEELDRNFSEIKKLTEDRFKM